MSVIPDGGGGVTLKCHYVNNFFPMIFEENEWLQSLFNETDKKHPGKFLLLVVEPKVTDFKFLINQKRKDMPLIWLTQSASSVYSLPSLGFFF